MAASRPVYVAFSKDRFEVVMPQNVRDADLAAALDPQYKRLPLTGPIVVAVNVPAAAPSDAVSRAREPQAAQPHPKSLVPYKSQRDVIRQQAATVADLEKRHK